MHRRFLVLLITFVGFLGFTIYVMVAGEVGLFPYLGALRPDSWSTQILVDLVIACTLLCIWMIRDAHARGKPVRSVVPFVVLTIALGSLGPLLYLLIREGTKDQNPAAVKARRGGASGSA